MKKLIIFLLGIMVIAACSHNKSEDSNLVNILSEEGEVTMSEGMLQTESPQPSQVDGNGDDISISGTSLTSIAGNSNTKRNTSIIDDVAKVNRKMIWTADIQFQVNDVETSTKALQEITTKYGGFMSSMNLSSTNYRISNTIQIRIANNKFNQLLDDFQSEAIFVDELNIRSNDVTEEFIDIQTRLKTKKEVRDRYIDVLRNKAGDVKDIIRAEEAIRKITEEIEAKEGRLRYLKDKLSYSTITATIYQEVDYKDEPKIYRKPYAKKLLEGLGNGWSFIKGFVLVLANIWPLLLLIGFVIWKGKWMIRKILK